MNEIVFTIMLLCNIQEKSRSLTDSQEACVDYYNNCIVKYGREWTDNDIVECVRENKE